MLYYQNDVNGDGRSESANRKDDGMRIYIGTAKGVEREKIYNGDVLTCPRTVSTG